MSDLQWLVLDALKSESKTLQELESEARRRVPPSWRGMSRTLEGMLQAGIVTKDTDDSYRIVPGADTAQKTQSPGEASSDPAAATDPVRDLVVHAPEVDAPTPYTALEDGCYRVTVTISGANTDYRATMIADTARAAYVSAHRQARRLRSWGERGLSYRLGLTYWRGETIRVIASGFTLMQEHEKVKAGRDSAVAACEALKEESALRQSRIKALEQQVESAQQATADLRDGMKEVRGLLRDAGYDEPMIPAIKRVLEDATAARGQKAQAVEPGDSTMFGGAHVEAKAG